MDDSELKARNHLENSVMTLKLEGVGSDLLEVVRRQVTSAHLQGSQLKGILKAVSGLNDESQKDLMGDMKKLISLYEKSSRESFDSIKSLEGMLLNEENILSRDLMDSVNSELSDLPDAGLGPEDFQEPFGPDDYDDGPEGPQ